MEVSAPAAGCVVCGGPVPPAIRSSRPRVTCSPACNGAHNSQIQRERALARITDKQRETLPVLYAAGLSYLKIGAALHLSESQTERLVRRLGLPLRGSPAQLKQRRLEAAQRHTSVLPSSTDASGAQPVLCADVSSSSSRASMDVPPEGARLFQRLVQAPVPLVPFRTCQWIEGDNPKTWAMCGAKTLTHSAYCAAHYRRAYTRRSEINQEAA